MRIWLKRWLAYVLVPIGLVLLFVPLSTKRMEWTERDVLVLQITEPLSAPENPATENLPQAKPDSLEEALQQMYARRQAMYDAKAREALLVNPYGYPKIRKEDLAPYPALAEELHMLEVLASIRTQPTRLESVMPEEWTAFRAAMGISSEDNPFQYGKFVLKGGMVPDRVYGPVEVRHLKVGCKVTGALFVAAGLFALLSTYLPPSGGIRIGKRSAIILWDIIIILFTGVFSLWFVDLLLAKIFQTVPDWGEDFAKGMGVFWVALANPGLALFTSATSAQTIWITQENIVLKGLFGATTMPWPEVEGIAVSQVHSPRQVAGKWAPHRVTKIFSIKGKNASLHVVEPPYASTKKEILAALMEHAPYKVKASIEKVSKEWFSYW